MVKGMIEGNIDGERDIRTIDECNAIIAIGIASPCDGEKTPKADVYIYGEETSIADLITGFVYGTGYFTERFCETSSQVRTVRDCIHKVLTAIELEKLKSERGDVK